MKIRQKNFFVCLESAIQPFSCTGTRMNGEAIPDSSERRISLMPDWVFFPRLELPGSAFPFLNALSGASLYVRKALALYVPDQG